MDLIYHSIFFVNVVLTL